MANPRDGATSGRRSSTGDAGDPIRAVRDAGQSIWLDFIHRGILKSGELGRLVQEGVSGVTSNPTIFEKAIDGSRDYDEQLSRLVAKGKSVTDIYEAVITDDIQGAADTLRPVHDATGGADGFVSIEVSPLVAHDTERTMQEVRRWNSLVARPNVMVKIPGTPEGVPAIEEMIFEGRHINITLLFSIEAYRRVQEAYLRGLERRAAAGQPVHQIASVASFFVSRIDTEADKRLEARAAETPPRQAEALRALRGKVAVANAKLAYRLFQETFAGPRWKALAGRGARVQRPLWASTSTKNPAYPDLLYVETLVGRDTVNTLPPQTIEALRDHGRIVPDAVTQGVDEAERVFAQLRELGISIDAITQTVLDAGVGSFADSFNQLMKAIGGRTRDVAAGGRR
ncbi:MAG TPA: transaldolase [bacterium]|nr:transaldolase [bacterium]